MVKKLHKILCILFLVFFFFACSSNGNATSAGKDDADTMPDVSDPSADEEPAENNDESADFDALIDEDVEIVEDLDVSDGDAFTDEDHGVSADEDHDPAEGPDSLPDEENGDTEPYDGETLELRIVAGNVTSGNKQSYDPGDGIRILQALRPDIVLVQEMNYGNNSSSDYKNFAQKIVGTNYYAVDSSDYQIPNGVLSRYPITSHGYWVDPNISNRALLWAVVDIPGEKDIFAVSVHLHTSPASDQVTASLVIVDEITKLKSANPDKYYYVVGGDFNGATSVSSSGFGKNNTFYVSGPHPVDENGDEETNANRNKHYDYVLADYPLHGFQVPTVFYSSKDPTKTRSYENGLVFDTRLYTQSELDEYFSPAQTSDSSASQMQHMAVVKDFLIEIK